MKCGMGGGRPLLALAVMLSLTLLGCASASQAPFAAVRWTRAMARDVVAALPAHYTAFEPHHAAALLGRSSFRSAAAAAAPLSHHDRVPMGEFPFPLPDGRLLHVRLLEYALLDASLTAERRDIRTFFVDGAAEDEHVRGALTYTADGWSGRLHSAADASLPDK